MTTLNSHRRFTFATALLVVLPLGHAQTSPKPAPTHKQAFEVAAVRLEDPNPKVDTNDPRFRSSPTAFPSNVLVMRHTMLKSLISQAYGVDYSYVLGGPDFIDQLHYDLNAKVEGDAHLTQVEMRPLLQNLLEERFHLKVHREQKIIAGYALVVAKGSPRLQPNKGAPFIRISSGDGLVQHNTSVAGFARMIASSMKQPVVDQTGIQGMYDIDLKFRPPTGPYIDDPRFAELPDIFTALQEKLGLKLVPQKAPIDTLVIDHVDKIPTQN